MFYNHKACEIIFPFVHFVNALIKCFPTQDAFLGKLVRTKIALTSNFTHIPIPAKVYFDFSPIFAGL